MSKTVSPELKVHFAQEVTTLATLLDIDRLDGESFYFTDSEEGILYNGNFYEPYTGYIPSAIETKINMSVDNQTITGALVADSIDPADIRAGLFDFANVTLVVVNYEDLGMGSMAMLVGKFGENIIGGNEFTIELRGMAQLLQQKMGEQYLASCPATFGDARCGINATDPDYTKPFVVTAIIVDEEKRTFQTDLVDVGGYFDSGFLTFDEFAANRNIGMDVKLYTQPDGRTELYEPLAYDIQVGDAGTIIVGCPKSFNACKTKFKVSNHLRFRGFPHLTGTTTALKGAG